MKTVAFLEAVEDITGGNFKVPRSEYRQSGQLPVVDQGKGLVSGYTDNTSHAFRHDGPNIIFGDHTRAMKYVDFPFAMGADGVKVLRTRGDFHPKFVYHYLRTVALPDAGYSRHFKFLKEIQVPRPPLDEQRRIAAILDRADALRAKRHHILAHTESITHSLFQNMFGDPIRNEMNWRTCRVDDLCNLVRGSSPRPQGDSRFFGGPVPRLMISDITRDGKSVTPTTDSLTVEGARRSRPCSGGTVVMAVSGNIGLVSRLAVDACIHDGFVGFLNLDENVILPGFLLEVLHLSKRAHDRSTAGAIFKNITTNDIKKTELITPPIEMQALFLDRNQSVDRIMQLQNSAQEILDELFTALQSRAFRGEL